jgi:CRISPR system Cascade subunit CasD
MTEREPTKSGVIGLVAAAMGRRRTDKIDDLLQLKLGVRIDQRGRLVRDFHAAHTFDNKQSFISNRYYLSDAIFVVGLESEDDELLRSIAFALEHPAFPLSFGRRSCPPCGKMVLDINQEAGLLDALKDTEHTEWQARKWYRDKQPKFVYLEIIADSDAMPEDEATITRRDVPVSFDQANRKYGFRSIISNPMAVFVDNSSDTNTKFHDPMEVL